MAINYNDSRFTDINKSKNTAMNEVNSMYDNMVNNTDKFYNDQISASNQYAETQSAIQQQQSDLAINRIEQQKEYQKQDYIKEQKAAYTDYKKQSNSYGVNAESLASRGLTGTGYAESSQVSMYNQYQNRYATARETYNRAIVDYDNQIKDAQLQNSSALAEIAYNALQKKLELSLEGFQYKNTLLQQQLEAKNNVEDRYYARWQDVVNQINTENSLSEQKRQFNEQMALEKQQFAWQKAQAKVSKSSGSSKSNSKGLSGSATINKTSSNSNGSMSNNAKLLYTTIGSTLKVSGVTGLKSVSNSTKELAKAAINKQYQDGSISANDVKLLVNKLGL